MSTALIERQALTGVPTPRKSSDEESLSRQQARPRILALLPDVPWPMNSGKRIREWTVIEGLSKIGDVDALVIGNSVSEFATPPGVELHSGATVHLERRSNTAAAMSLASGRPWRIAALDWSPARQAIAGLGTDYDLVWFGSADSWLQLNPYVQASSVIVDMDDIETEKISSFLAGPSLGTVADSLDRTQGRIERRMWKRIQRRLANEVSTAVVCSKDDAEILGTQGTAVLPNCYPQATPSTSNYRKSANIITLVGAFSYEPNIEGARFMATKVMPLVRRRIPDARLHLVGRGGNAEFFDLGKRPGVEAIGEVADTSPYLAMSRVAVAPVHFGGGTRIKLLEAFAHGVPAVSTSVGCHGLGVTDDVDVLIRDNAADFAEACCALLTDEALATRIARAGHQHYVANYRPETAIAQVSHIAQREMNPRTARVR